RHAAGLADPLLTPAVAGLEGRRRQADDGAHLPAITELPPAEQFVDQKPGAAQADAGEFEQASHGLYLRRVALADAPLAFGLQIADLLIGQLPASELAT